VRAEWVKNNPDLLGVNESGYAAPEKCLAQHLLQDVSGPIHLEVCNASFENNVTQRLQGAQAMGDWGTALDPRGVCLWLDGERSDDAFEKLQRGNLVFPTLPEALSMLGIDESQAENAAEVIQDRRNRADGTSVRGDVV
ncbi:MAG: hypothetical protein ABEI52_07275, partial [Halobacteriaceae archaeon]